MRPSPAAVRCRFGWLASVAALAFAVSARAEAAPEGLRDSLASPGRRLSLGLRERAGSLALERRAEEALQAGRYEEVKALLFRILDDDPFDLRALDSLAYALAALPAATGPTPEPGAPVGPDPAAEAAELRDPELRSLARMSGDGFAQASAVYDWGGRLHRSDPRYLIAYATHLALDQGRRLQARGEPARARAAFESALAKLDAAISVLGPGADAGARARARLWRGHLRRRLAGLAPKAAASLRSRALADYRAVLAEDPAQGEAVREARDAARQALRLEPAGPIERGEPPKGRRKALGLER
ncbi:MAG: hypothetical protein HY554_17450 [Elusimicrobia bacterium]|nr:hypothetical protein [Elusimicrobiota bacterium]